MGQFPPKRTEFGLQTLDEITGKKEEEKPQLSQDEKKFERAVDHEQDQRYFENTDEVNTFWRGLWETESKDNLDVNWIKEVEESMGAEVSEEEIAERVEVTTDEVKRVIGKKRNWSGAGRDKIRNFWWKKLTVLHKHIASVFETLINEERDIDLQWLVMEETDMIRKEGEWSAANQRPITLLNTCYKWLTGILKDKMESYLEKFNMLQCDQRGGRKGTWGVVKNLMIDAMVLEECCMRKKNLS